MRGRRRSRGLTEREREVLALVRLGLTNEEIAGRLGITLDGAKYHVSQILAKLGVSTREEAAMVEEEPLPWWARALAWSAAAKAAVVATMLAIVIGLGVMAWAVLATGSGDSTVAVAPTATPSGPTPVPWVDSTPGPLRTPSPEPTPGPELLSVRACQASDLSSGFVGTHSQGGYDFFTLGFVNVSSTPCRLQGVPPSFQLLDADGNVTETAPLKNCPNASVCGDNVPILQPGSGAPLPLGTPSASQALLTAQSFPAVTCPPASAVSLVLPENGGQLTIPVDSLKACGADPLAFVSDAPPGTPARTPTPVFSIGLQLPAAVRAGDQLDFLVSFTNVSGAPVSLLSPCPSYDIWLGPKQVIGAHSLNCGSVGAIPPGQSVWFDMKLRIPANMLAGFSDVTWQWDGEDYVFEPSVYDRAGSSVIEILPPAPGVSVPSSTLDPNQPTFDNKPSP